MRQAHASVLLRRYSAATATYVPITRANSLTPKNRASGVVHARIASPWGWHPVLRPVPVDLSEVATLAMHATIVVKQTDDTPTIQNTT